MKKTAEKGKRWPCSIKTVKQGIFRAGPNRFIAHVSSQAKPVFAMSRIPGAAGNCCWTARPFTWRKAGIPPQNKV